MHSSCSLVNELALSHLIRQLQTSSIKLHAFEITIHSGFLKSVYNLLLSVFSDAVRSYLEATVRAQLNGSAQRSCARA